jgi:hypothetical protein
MKIKVIKQRSYLAVKPLSGSGKHKDKRYKRLRTRNAINRKAIKEE